MSNQSSGKPERPLSPHLQIYRLPFNARMSIAGRGVGVGLSLALSVILLALIAVIWVPSLYAPIMEFLHLSAMQYVMLLAAGVTFFYLGNGIRHVLWDMVVGVNVKFGVMTGRVTLFVAALLTIGLWFLGFSGAETVEINEAVNSAVAAE